MQAKLKRKPNNTDEEELKEAFESVKSDFGSKYHLQFCIPCDGNKKRETAIHKFFFVQESLLYHWSHEYPQLYDPMINSKTTGLRKILIFRHFDLRPFKPYTRVTNSDYLENAIKARELNENNRAQKKSILMASKMFGVSRDFVIRTLQIKLPGPFYMRLLE